VQANRSSVVILVVVGAAVTLCAAGDDNGWRNLEHVTRDRDYTVVLRDLRCIQGRLLSTGDDAISLQIDQARQAIIKRARVLRVGEYRNAPSHDTVFSGRSSWADVVTGEPKASEYLLIVTKKGEQVHWHRPNVSESSVSGDGKTLLKSDVRLVSYVRFTPLTRQEEYAEHEGVALAAPRLWFNLAMLGEITVPLYDSDVTEDNSPVTCK
jgi:hypothetical protein